MSERAEIRERISNFVSNNSLNCPYGDSGKHGKYHYVLFSKPRTLDGAVNIYSPKFIQVKYQTAFRTLPQYDSRVFCNEDDTIDFIRLAFIEHKYDDAMKIPVKQK